MKKLAILILVITSTVFSQIIQEEVHNLSAVSLEEKIDNLFNKLETFYSDKNISSIEGLTFKSNISSKEEKKKEVGFNDYISPADSVYNFFTYSLNNIQVLNDSSILVNASIVLFNLDDKKEITCDFLIHRFKESFFFDEAGMIRELKGIINSNNVSNKYTESLNRINNSSFIPFPHTTCGAL